MPPPFTTALFKAATCYAATFLWNETSFLEG